MVVIIYFTSIRYGTASNGIYTRFVVIITCLWVRTISSNIIYIVTYRPVARQRPQNKEGDKSRCYATERLTCLYNNRFTFGNGDMQSVVRQLQQLDYNNGNGGVLCVILAEELP
jgi:hypothetical protein